MIASTTTTANWVLEQYREQMAQNNKYLQYRGVGLF